MIKTTDKSHIPFIVFLSIEFVVHCANIHFVLPFISIAISKSEIVYEGVNSDIQYFFQLIFEIKDYLALFFIENLGLKSIRVIQM